MPYRLYVDEVGNDDMFHTGDERHRYLSLSGVAMDPDHVRDYATPAVNALKSILKHDPDKHCILHRKDIMNKNGVFKSLGDAAICQAFDASMVKLFTDADYTLITIVIDKLRMREQAHWVETHPYHYLMKILVEKYVQWLEREGGTGDVMPEMRRGIKDKELQRAFSFVYENGSDYVNYKRIQRAIPAKSLKFRSKEDNITGLQLCDLIAHPSHMYVRQQQGHPITLGPFAQKITPILRAQKYDRSPWNGRIEGYGTKYLP